MEKKTASAIMLTLLLISMLTLAFNIQPVKAEETIYIMADGSIDPPTAHISTVDNITYTFTDNIYDEIVVQRSNITIDGVAFTLQGSGSGNGVKLESLGAVAIRNINIKGFEVGVLLQGAPCNVISGNNITNNNQGIALGGADSNNISTNRITNNNYYGIHLDSSFGNSISGNDIENNILGIYLERASSNIISRNNIIANGLEIVSPSAGIFFASSSNNSIYGNNIKNNYCGINLWISCFNNTIYYNDFVNNTYQVSTFNTVNVWDDGYPSGGNYWSDYTGVDEFSGSNQDVLGSDGIGDTPYVIDENNRDRYPIMKPLTPIPPNHPPNSPTYLFQYRADGTEIPVGGTIGEDTVTLLGVVRDPDGDRVKLQIELRRLDEYAGSFIGIPTHESEFVESDYGVTISIYGLISGSYHWSARTADEYGLVSDWVDFGNNDISEADFKFVIPEIVFRPPYAIGIGDLGFADKFGTGRALYYSYAFPQDGYGMIGSDTHVFPGGGYAWAEADFILGDSWTCTYSGEYDIVASFAIDGFMRVFYASVPKWGKGYSMAILKVTFSIYDKTDRVEVLQEDLPIFEEKIEWSPLPIQIPRYKPQRYSNTPFSIAGYTRLEQGHEYEWNFRIHVGGYAIVALGGSGIAGGYITAYLNEVRIKTR